MRPMLGLLRLRLLLTVHPPAKTSPQPPAHISIIHHYYHMVGYAIAPHHLSLADNYSNTGNRSECTPRQEGEAIVSHIVS